MNPPADDDLQRQAARIDAVYQADEVIGDGDRSLQRLLKIAVQLTGARAAVFSLVAERRSIVKASLGMEPGVAELLWPLEQAVTRADDLCWGDDGVVRADRQTTALTQKGVCASQVVGVPVRVPSGLIVGVLSLISESPWKPDARLIESLQDMRALLEDWVLLRSASIVDALTGLFNRRYFEELVAREWRRSLRHLSPITMLMIDIDYFKRLNDSLGHEAGDAALRQVAGILRAQFRRGGDVVARYGGEEFVVILPETSLEAALQLASRACRSIEDAQFRHPDSPYEALTVSIGVASADTELDRSRGPVALLNRADQALYEAKRRGRNRAVADPAAAYR